MKNNTTDNLRDNLSIDFCQGLIYRLGESQDKQTKINALIAIKNLVTETGVKDPIIYDPLIDSLSDKEKEVKDLAVKVIKLIMCEEIKDLLKIKVNNTDDKTKKLIEKLLT